MIGINPHDLECDECGKDDNDCVVCKTCDLLLCRSCVNHHDKSHSIIDPQNS